MTMKDPAFLFYSSDFLTGTMFMTYEQVGKYIKLLCVQHQNGILLERDMLKICGSYDEDIYSKFIKTDKGYYNERLYNETIKRSKYSESRRNNRKRKHIDEGHKHIDIISKTYPKDMVIENENENESKDLNKKKDKKRKFSFRYQMMMNGFDIEVTDEWMQIRKAKKMVNTKTAFDRFIKQCDIAFETHNINRNELLKLIVSKSWGGFEAEWLTNINNNQNQQNNAKQKQLGATATISRDTDYSKPV
jgi:hypothetical protein